MEPHERHIGRNISRVRELLGVKQEALAFSVGMSQQSVSILERSARVDDEKITLVATALHVSPNVIKNFDEKKVLINNLSQEAGVQAAAAILQMNPLPDAIFAANDNCAVGCMIALKKAGIRIPHDMAFAGFNNDPVSTVIEPNLTTINYPGYKMGEMAAASLINHLNGVNSIDTTNTILLRSELIIRASSLKTKSDSE